MKPTLIACISKNPSSRVVSLRSALFTALLLAPLALHAADTKQSKRPNVIFILTDDQGWGDL
jgi:hypothetical protein